ncbi:MAG: SIR2 family protein [Chloroflexi bacterium]|nr:SIR2 family protein [Chloroflexota bacterium]
MEQLKAVRVGYLLGAGSSYLDNAGYPLAFEVWDMIKDRITDLQKRTEIQSKMNHERVGLEQALDLLDDGGATDTPYYHLVIEAIADLFLTKNPNLDVHIEFVRRLSQRGEPNVKIFSLNYDPLVERAAEATKVRLVDGFLGVEHAFFDASVFEERLFRIRGSYRGRQPDETAKPLRLLKLHGSLGWYECRVQGIRRCAYISPLPNNTKRLMVPPQRRKATDTMLLPYSALWSIFRGCLSHNENPINRLACFGYGFNDEHVNAVIEAAMARTDFTLLIFTKELSDTAWNRWSVKPNAVVVTETRCSLKAMVGPGHPDLWRFERLCKEV